MQKTNHLYIDLPAIKEKLEAWIKTTSVNGFWANNAIQMTQAWIRDGLRERAITRDLKWGIPVPKAGYEKKVFYVWFDAPIGYISITGTLGEEIDKDNWRQFVNYWWKSPDDVELFQFIGKDNIPFHTVIFPSSLLGSADSLNHNSENHNSENCNSSNNEKWTMLYHMSSSEYLNYEDGKFSKSRGVGVFGDDVMNTGIPADVWRFYIFYNRPEKSDAMFTWDDFQEKVNGELIGNFGNLVNRTLSFVTRYYDGKIPVAGSDPDFWAVVNKHEKSIADKLNKAELRDAFREVFELSSFANKYFQEAEPWKLRSDNPEKAAQVISDLAFIVRDLAVLAEPFIPRSAAKIASFFGLKLGETLCWKGIGKPQLSPDIQITSEVLFAKLEDDQIKALREKYAGTQEQRANSKEQQITKLAFVDAVDLRVAKIEKIERHPKADKLYIETLETAEGVTGEREERVIVSGLVPFYTEEQLLGKKIIVAYNLKPAKLRGIESRGMLLAAGDNKDGVERVEALDAGGYPTGTRLLPEGEETCASPAEIDIDTFFSYPIAAKNHEVFVDGKRLCLNGNPIRTTVISDGEVH